MLLQQPLHFCNGNNRVGGILHGLIVSRSMDGQANVTASGTSELRIEQLRQIASDPSQARAHAMQLLRALRTDDDEVAGWVNDCLQLVEELPSDLVPELSSYCTDSNVAIASWACKLIGRLGDDASVWQDVLADALTNHPSTAVKQAAAAALANTPGLSAATLQAVTLASQTDDARLKRLTEQALASAKP